MMFDLSAAGEPPVASVAAASERLAADGFVVARAVIDGAAVASLAARVEALFASPHPQSRQVLYVDGQVPPETPPLDRLLHQWLNPHRLGALGTADLLDAPRRIAAALLDAAPVLFQDLLLVKTPEQARFPWHQDFPFWPVDAPRGVVCWIPLVASEAAGGGLTFARGSHHLGVQPVMDLHRGRPQAPGAALASLDGFDAVCPPLRPGDAVFFSPLVMHGSPPRRASGRRAAWSSIWLHPSVRWQHARAPAHPLCKVVTDGAPVSEWAAGA
ncbi:MAG: phytanoyl-CoA dioxygenase family protein [Myxococcales bacterium]|nr:phytanoyl-CoA dioxygenase family protein [Myxococcales bacterium]